MFLHQFLLIFFSNDQFCKQYFIHNRLRFHENNIQFMKTIGIHGNYLIRFVAIETDV